MTYAELKRMADSGEYVAQMTYRYGADIPERLQGWRKIVKSKSSGLVLQNADGRPSDLRIDSAKLVDFDGETLRIYGPGLRDLTEDEKAILQAEKATVEACMKDHPFGEPYYDRVRFYRDHKDYEYLAGWDVVRGKKYFAYKNQVQDNSIKGCLELAYQIRKA